MSQHNFELEARIGRGCEGVDESSHAVGFRVRSHVPHGWVCPARLRRPACGSPRPVGNRLLDAPRVQTVVAPHVEESFRASGDGDARSRALLRKVEGIDGRRVVQRGGLSMMCLGISPSLPGHGSVVNPPPSLFTGWRRAACWVHHECPQLPIRLNLRPPALPGLSRSKLEMCGELLCCWLPVSTTPRRVP